MLKLKRDMTSRPIAQISRVNDVTLRGLAIFYVVIFGGLALILTRTQAAFWAGLPLVGAYHLHTHFTNFALSAILLMTAGITAFTVRKAPWIYIGTVAAVIAILNVIMETFVTIANTRDGYDTVAGMVGIVVGFLGLLLVRAYGLTPSPLKNQHR